MNCQTLCQSAFTDIFKPVLEHDFADALPVMSAGVVGGGSDTLGSDDELSHDHDWGLGRCRLFLPENEASKYGTDIASALSAAVPDEYLGFNRDILRPDTIAVTTIDAIYERLCGYKSPPTTLREWVTADGSALGMARYGLVIYDPPGVLSKRKQAFETAYYPEEIRRWKMATILWNIWQFGDYNTVNRLGKRRDNIGVLVGQGYFVESVMRFVCMLNKRFSLYWKWLHWQFQQMPKWSNEFGVLLQALDTADNYETRVDYIAKICQKVREALHQEGLLPDERYRETMGAFDLVRTIESNEVRILIKEMQPNFDVWSN